MSTLTSTVDVPAGKALLEVMDRSGDTRVEWDRSNPDEVKSARRTFDELMGKRFMAFSVTGKKGRKQGEQIRTFDETAERIIMTPPLAGG